MKYRMVMLLLIISITCLTAVETTSGSDFVRVFQKKPGDKAPVYTVFYGKVKLLSPLSDRLISINDTTIVSLDFVTQYQSVNGYYSRYTYKPNNSVFFPKRIQTGKIDLYATDGTYYPSTTLLTPSTPNHLSPNAKSLYYTYKDSDLQKVRYSKIRKIVKDNEESLASMNKYRNLTAISYFFTCTVVACMLEEVNIMISQNPSKEKELTFGVSAAMLMGATGVTRYWKRNLIRKAINQYNR